MSKQYLGDKEIMTVSVSEKKTPGGHEVVEVRYENGSKQTMPRARFDLLNSDEINDASGVQLKVRRHVGALMYSVMHEYGLTFAETNDVLDEAAQLVQNAADKATNILFGVEFPSDRTVNQINDILIEHASKTSNNEDSSAGSGADSEDQE